MQFEVKRANENVARLAEDQARTEKQLEELWKHCFFLQKEFEIKNDNFAEKPTKQKLRCDSCHCLTDKYKISVSEHGYAKLIECLVCYEITQKQSEKE